MDFKLNFKSVEGALDHTLSVLKDLQKRGIKVEKFPSSTRFIQEIIDDYRDVEGRLKPENWYHVELIFKNPEQEKIIYEAQKDLFKLGITFDWGGISGIRDWELDWSFHIIKTKKEKREKKKRMSIVSDVQQSVFNKILN